ncbi:MAG TPA: RNA degradosome polyphosphate kinase, partial [Caulobacteraceae bacterium]
MSEPLAVNDAPLNLDEALLASPERFFNRELSWLAFNRRVLEEAENPRHPLLERLRFLSISAGNLDEFYMVRVAGLKGQVREGVRVVSQDGLTPQEQLARVNEAAADLMADQQRIWSSIRAELGTQGLRLVSAADVQPADREVAGDIFLSRIFPVLTPLAIDPAHPFPFIPNLSFSLALKLRRQSDGKALYALVPVPTQVKRFWELTSPEMRGQKGERRFLALESFLVLFLDHLFPGCDVEARGTFRLIRDSDVEIEEEAEDLVREFEARLKLRRLGSVVRVKIEASMPGDLRDFITDGLKAEPDDVVIVDGKLGLAQFEQLIPADRGDLKFPPFSPRFPER